MIQKIFEAAMLGNVSEFQELLTKELNRRIHEEIDTRVENTINATYNMCEECDWDEDDDTWTDEDVDAAYFDENEDDPYEEEDDDLSEEEDHDARELHLYASNHADLHRQRTTPIHKNLRNKQAAGTYDSNKAHKAFGHAAKDAADRYHKEHGHRFSKGTRDKVAAKMRDEFEAASKAGEHDHLLHKKHQKKKNESVELDEMRPWSNLGTGSIRDTPSMKKYHAELQAAHDAKMKAYWAAEKAKEEKAKKAKKAKNESVENLDEKKKNKKAKKDHDGDGKIETGTQEWRGSVDKAIKKAIASRGGN